MRVPGRQNARDDHRRGVRADVAGESLDLLGQIDQLANFVIGVVGLLQFVACFERLLMDASFAVCSSMLAPTAF